MSQSAFSYEVNCIYSSVPHIMKPALQKTIEKWLSSSQFSVDSVHVDATEFINSETNLI